MALSKIKFEDYRLELLQQNVHRAIDESKTILSDGRLIKDVVLTTAGRDIDHKLGRTPVGFLVISRNANANVWLTAKSATVLSLDSSATVTVDLWVF